MQSPAIPPDETERLAALHALHILDTPPEERFDRITRLAARLFDVPISLVSLVDADRQWFKSNYGLAAQQSGRDISFCGHTILQEDGMIVPDTLLDPRFVDNPFVTEPPKIRFYAGQPMHSPDGHRVGTLCIIDLRPREWSVSEQQTLKDLAAWVELELASRELAGVLGQLHEANERLRRLNEVRGEFVSIVSHDFRTALTGIQGFSEMIRDENFTKEEIHEYAADINEDARRLNQMIAELLKIDRAVSLEGKKAQT